jgi:hypothetical protein
MQSRTTDTHHSCWLHCQKQRSQVWMRQHRSANRLDSLSALQALQSGKSETLIDILVDKLGSLLPIERVVIQWIPAHTGVSGNEQADHLAKQGSMLPQFQHRISHRESKTLLKSSNKSSWSRQTGSYKAAQDSIHQIDRKRAVLKDVVRRLFSFSTGNSLPLQFVAYSSVIHNVIVLCGVYIRWCSPTCPGFDGVRVVFVFVYWCCQVSLYEMVVCPLILTLLLPVYHAWNSNVCRNPLYGSILTILYLDSGSLLQSSYMIGLLKHQLVNFPDNALSIIFYMRKH